MTPRDTPLRPAHTRLTSYRGSLLLVLPWRCVAEEAGRLRLLCGGNAELLGQFIKWMSGRRRDRLRQLRERDPIMHLAHALTFCIMGPAHGIAGARGFEQEQVNEITLLTHIITASVVRLCAERTQQQQQQLLQLLEEQQREHQQQLPLREQLQDVRKLVRQQQQQQQEHFERFLASTQYHLRRTVHGGSDPQVAPLMAALRHGEASNEAKLKLLISKLMSSVSHGLSPVERRRDADADAFDMDAILGLEPLQARREDDARAPARGDDNQVDDARGKTAEPEPDAKDEEDVARLLPSPGPVAGLFQGAMTALMDQRAVEERPSLDRSGGAAVVDVAALEEEIARLREENRQLRADNDEKGGEIAVLMETLTNKHLPANVAYIDELPGAQAPDGDGGGD